MDYESLFKAARKAGTALTDVEPERLGRILQHAARLLRGHTPALLEANARDIEAMPASSPMLARLRLTPRQKLEPGYWASADGKAALAEIEAMLAANPRCIIETNDAGGNQLTADYAAARGIDLDGLRVGISGSVGQMFGALFGSEHLGTLLLTGGDTLLQCMNSVGARELEPVCELESGIVLARFTYQGRTRYVITKSGGFGQEDLLVELADRIAKH